MPPIPEPTRFPLSGGRVLDAYLAGPEDGTPLISHHGTPGAGLPFGPFVQAAAERGVRWVSYSRPGYGASSRRADRSVADCLEDVAAILEGLGVEPIALWQGRHDKMVPSAHGEWLADHVPGVRAHLLEDDGHLSIAVSSFAAVLDDMLDLAKDRL
jgi:pimeloyl-ACP methyl ester carboxylesterase